jgi:hypothetical protein
VPWEAGSSWRERGSSPPEAGSSPLEPGSSRREEVSGSPEEAASPPEEAAGHAEEASRPREEASARREVPARPQRSTRALVTTSPSRRIQRTSTRNGPSPWAQCGSTSAVPSSRTRSATSWKPT